MGQRILSIIALIRFTFIGVVLLYFVVHTNTSAQVKVSEESMTIPTYLVDPPNPMPRFYEGTSHQGVQRHMYPYPMNDNLTGIKEDRNYPVINFENDLVKLAIMPELGGRIFYALDKTNDYTWFYRQHVIKPSLIGMIGYWISGSNAWGFPHHHGPNTVKPMDHKVVENENGSRTIWIANTDQFHRMRIMVGYTLYPNSSLVEMTIRPMNRTPIANSFLFWANPSVHVDTNYQVLFPPSVQYVTQHAKHEMTTWPIANGRYNRFDYTNVDISRWKNIGVPSSFFSWDPKEDYFGGYDHGKEAGTVWLGNHHTCPGMKFWAWGNNPAGDRSNAGLTDDDGHYIELMAGAFTDNQPDYSWIQPYENKDVTMIWFPVRELGGLKFANRNGALNLVVNDNKILVRINTTCIHDEARVLLKAKNQVLLDEVINISPAKPYSADIQLPSGIVEDDLDLSLSTKSESLLSYKPADHHPPDVSVPDPLKAPEKPENIKSVEELYYTGLRLNQFYNANLDPMPYYEEALKRDPENYRVNTQLGILALKGKNLTEAKKRFQIAVDRITSNYTRARDGEAQYYLGYVLKHQGKLDEAYDLLYDATWSAAWQTPAFYQLAEIDCMKGDFETALDHVTRAISTNTENLPALNLKAIVLRKLGRLVEATDMLDVVLAKDVLNHQAGNERILLSLETGKVNETKRLTDELSSLMRDEVQSYLELAVDYGNAGCFDEALRVLKRLETKDNQFPMLYYYTGYYLAKSGSMKEALDYFKKASLKPHEYCFPFRIESVDVLNLAMEMNPTDARAPYYLGNLFYETLPEKAIELWQKSVELDNSFYIVHRNLAQAYEEIENDISKAMKSMETAVACNSDDPRLLFEMDELYEKNKESSEKKYDLLKENSATAKRRTESMLRLATRSLEIGKYDEALDILLNNEFPQFEGGREMQDTYLNAFTLRGLDYFNKGENNLAQADFEKALSYPVGRFGRSRWAQFHYLLGNVYEILEQDSKANDSYLQCINTPVDDNGLDQEYNYYRGLALIKTNKTEEANSIFEKMLTNAQSEESNTFFRQFEGGLSKDRIIAANHYLAGLAYEGLGQMENAKTEYNTALELDPGHVWSKNHLSSL